MTYGTFKRIILIGYCFVFWVGLIGGATAAAEREHITSQELADTGYIPSEPVQNANFLPVGESGQP